jgi:molybdopterin synthase catalytic subunit
MSKPREQQVKIQVLFFGAARDAVGGNTVELSLGPAPTVAMAFEQLVTQFPGLERFERSLLFAVNEEYATRETKLSDKDELAIFPPVSGGAISSKEKESTEPCSDFYEITTGLLNIGKICRRVVLPECGATVTLDGYARQWTAGRKTKYLVYEAYEPMALAEMEKLGNEARRRFDISHIGIVHRTGRVEIGETSVVISVSAPHRKAAFEACEWAIRELKRTVPIWKKEVFDDGEQWVEGEEQSAKS